MVKTNKKAFSLVELMVSMIIIIIIALVTLPVITKVKPDIEIQTIKGQFACWVDNNHIFQQYFDERSQRGEPLDVTAQGHCTLTFNQRPANYYILAIGAGANEEGQLATYYSPVLNQKLTIFPGSTPSHSFDTIIKAGDINGTTILEAKSGATGNFIDPDNLASNAISSCNLLYANPSSYCPNATRCEAIDIYNGPVIRVISETGTCSNTDMTYGNMSQNMTYLSSTRRYNAIAQTINYNDVTLEQQAMLSSANNTIYQDVSNQYQFSFKLNPSYKVIPSKMFNLVNNTANYDYTNPDYETQFVKFIDLVNTRRITPLLKRQESRSAILGKTSLPTLNPGAPYAASDSEHGGAVLILW